MLILLKTRIGLFIPVLTTLYTRCTDIHSAVHADQYQFTSNFFLNFIFSLCAPVRVLDCCLQMLCHTDGPSWAIKSSSLFDIGRFCVWNGFKVTSMCILECLSLVFFLNLRCCETQAALWRLHRRAWTREARVKSNSWSQEVISQTTWGIILMRWQLNWLLMLDIGFWYFFLLLITDHYLRSGMNIISQMEVTKWV